jgi:DNA-binding NarL/FixJ family response regulator
MSPHAVGGRMPHRAAGRLGSPAEGSPISSSQDHPARVRVGVVDDHPAIGAAFAAAVEAADGLELVGTGRTTAAALDLADRVDVLVCDVQLEGHAEGLAILDALHDPHRLATRGAPPAVLLVSGFGQVSVIRAAIERGAAGYLDKSAELPEIVAAIRTVAGGGTVFSASHLQASRSAPRRPSDRELQVIGAVASGLTNAETAARLDLSEKTVESHLRRLFDRYGLLSRTELAVLAIDEGWIADARGDR